MWICWKLYWPTMPARSKILERASEAFINRAYCGCGGQVPLAEGLLQTFTQLSEPRANLPSSDEVTNWKILDGLANYYVGYEADRESFLI